MQRASFYMVFDKLKQWFSFGSKDTAGSALNLSHGIMVAQWLKRYQEQHQLVRFSTQASTPEEETVHAGIFEVDPVSKRFSLKELRPKTTVNQLQPGIKLYCMATVDGIKHRFTARYLKSENASPLQLHVCEFPDAIKQVQLRNAYRVKIPPDAIVSLCLTHGKTPLLSGHAHDLSATGAKLRVEGPLSFDPLPGDTYPMCRLTLPDGIELFCEAELMHWHYQPEQNVTYLGFMFSRLNSMHARTLSKFLTDLQRKEKERQRHS